MKILISWYAYTHDFRDGAVSDTSPTLEFHRHFFDHDRHIILSSATADDTRLDLIVNRLKHDFPDRASGIDPRYMDIRNDELIMPGAIKPKIEALLQSFADAEIDLFISPGTPAMQVAWYLCHESMGLQTRLLQTVEARLNKGEPRLVVTQLSQSPEPVSVLIREQLTSSNSEDYLITNALKPVYARADKVAQTDRVTCLICGASGTGKEHLAQYMHRQSARAGRPFVAVNCAALGNELLESRLFGYVKGAFTGAVNNQTGFFDEANGGTLFLDEIGDITPYMQQSLLRVVQSGEFMPVGATTPRHVDVRIIAASHRNLRQRCADEQFRWDLYYRLATTELTLPTLAERGQAEKRQLVNFFLKAKQAVFRRKKSLTISPAAWAYIDAYLFPGNVRELENLIESLYVFASETVMPTDLPDWLRNPASITATFDWRQHEKQLIEQALVYFGQNKTKTYQSLGYGSVNTLIKKMAEYGVG